MATSTTNTECDVTNTTTSHENLPFNSKQISSNKQFLPKIDSSNLSTANDNSHDDQCQPKSLTPNFYSTDQTSIAAHAQSLEEETAGTD